MAFVDKNIILNVIIMIGLFNFAFLIGAGFLVERFTGDVVLTGSINSGETFEGSPIFIKNNDIAFSFGTRVTGEELRRETLNITMITPEGIEYSWLKRFECEPDLEPGENPLIYSKSCLDFSMIFTPKSTGRYYIKITDAKFNTDIKLISGMVNPTKKPLVFIGAMLFWFVIMIVAKVFNNQISGPSKKQALIAFMISLITTYVVVLYSSM